MKDETYTCPECGEECLRIVGYENYGADRDGNHGVRVPVYQCGNCGYEEAGAA